MREIKSRITKILVCLVMTGQMIFMPVSSFAQSAPATLVPLSAAYNPMIIKGLQIYPDEPLRFDFIVENGENKISDEQYKKESEHLIKYFMASLAVPEKDMWVNLSPYEKNRIIPQTFNQTQMGIDLLAQDYLLKQITASLMYPDGEVGKQFWAKVNAQAKEKFNISQVPIETFNKVWIVPDKAEIYVHNNIAYIANSRLKVMLEKDYLALQNSRLEKPAEAVRRDSNEMSQMAGRVVKEIVIPVLDKEVNEGKHFALLRQMYNSMLLATWYKHNVKNSIVNDMFTNRNKPGAAKTENPGEKDKIYQNYVETFKKGVYNYIREEYDEKTDEMVPRKYFSGGVALGEGTPVITRSGSSVILERLRKSWLGQKTYRLVRTNLGGKKIPSEQMADELVAASGQPDFANRYPNTQKALVNSGNTDSRIRRVILIAALSATASGFGPAYGGQPPEIEYYKPESFEELTPLESNKLSPFESFLGAVIKYYENKKQFDKSKMQYVYRGIYGGEITVMRFKDIYQFVITSDYNSNNQFVWYVRKNGGFYYPNQFTLKKIAEWRSDLEDLANNGSRIAEFILRDKIERPVGNYAVANQYQTAAVKERSLTDQLEQYLSVLIKKQVQLTPGISLAIYESQTTDTKLWLRRISYGFVLSMERVQKDEKKTVPLWQTNLDGKVISNDLWRFRSVYGPVYLSRELGNIVKDPNSGDDLKKAIAAGVELYKFQQRTESQRLQPLNRELGRLVKDYMTDKREIMFVSKSGISILIQEARIEIPATNPFFMAQSFAAGYRLTLTDGLKQPQEILRVNMIQNGNMIGIENSGFRQNSFDVLTRLLQEGGRGADLAKVLMPVLSASSSSSDNDLENISQTIVKNPGGIDLDPGKTKMNVTGQQIEMKQPDNPVYYEYLFNNEIAPNILQIQNIPSMPVLLGLNEAAPAKEAVEPKPVVGQDRALPAREEKAIKDLSMLEIH